MFWFVYVDVVLFFMFVICCSLFYHLYLIKKENGLHFTQINVFCPHRKYDVLLKEYLIWPPTDSPKVPQLPE